MFKTAPNPKDVQDLQFKLRCHLKIFENEENTAFPRHCSLVACASRFGLVFIGSNRSNVQVIQCKDIEKLTKGDGDKADYPRRNLLLPSAASHLCVNCEHDVLAVVIEKNNFPCVLFYDVKSFWQKNVTLIREVCLSSIPGVYVTETNWNPAIGSIFTACKSDGTLGIYEIKDSTVDVIELPAAAGATCFCWSPKGKQIAVGSRDGKITQLKPDLKAVKVINAPPLKEPHSLLSLQWISNYQFIGVFQSLKVDGQAVFIVIDAPKSGDPTYVNYDDICYSNGNVRPVQFYMILLQSWNIVMAASSNSMEIGILGNTGEGWSQWIMGDAARAELPLNAKHQETFPVGCGLDIASMQAIPWGESTLPPAPLLLLLSHHGTLCCFNVINLKEGVPSLCTPPDIFENSAADCFITSGIEQKTNPMAKELAKITPQSVTQSHPADGGVTTTRTPSTLINPSTILKNQPQTTSITQSASPSPNPLLNLFGGQATITPITQENKNAPTYMSQYQTILPSPISNATKNSTETSIQMLPTTAPLMPTIPKPVASVVADLTLNNASKVNQSQSGEDINKAEVISVDLKAEEEAEKIFGQMVREECIFLESEVKAVLHQGKKLKYNLGVEADKMKLVESTNSLEDFFHEVADICVTQNGEVHILKQNLLQSWAWYEEAKSRHLASEDESVVILIRAQPLDSASEKQLSVIQHTNYYLESQISQAHIALDEQWENFQDYCKKTHKLQIPTMELIFQTMVKQNAILRKQSYILKDIGSRIKNKSHSALGSSLLLTVDDKDLPEEFRRLRMNPEDIYQIRHEHVEKRMKNFTKTKADTLRSFLKKREYPHISAVKPQLSTSVIHTSPSSKLRQHSLLTSKEALIGGETFSKKLDFVHSTPLSTLKDQPVTSEISPSTPIEGLQNFALKFEAKNFTKLSEKATVTPLSKNLIASSPHSAFVSTSLGSNISTSTVSSSSSKPIFLGLSSATTATLSVPKTVPSFVVTSLQATQPMATLSVNLPKPFSFVNPPASTVSSQEYLVSESGINMFSNSGTKPIIPFGIETVSNKSAFEVADTKNVPAFKQTTSFSNITDNVPNLTRSMQLATSATSTSGSVVSSNSSSAISSSTNNVTLKPSVSFSSSSASSIFAVGNQKLSEPPASNSVTQPFVFFSKAITPASSTTQNLPITTVSSAQPANSATTAVTMNVPNVYSSIFAAPSNTTKSSAVSSSDIFTLPPTVSITKVNTTSAAVQPSIFNSAVSAASTQPTIFSSGSKPSLFTSTATINASTVSPVSTSSAVGIVSPSKSSNSFIGSVSGSEQSAVAKQTVLVSDSNSNNKASTLPLTTSVSGTTPSGKMIFTTVTETPISKPSIFGSSLTASTTSDGTPAPTPITQSSVFGVLSPSTTTGTSIFGAISSAPTVEFTTLATAATTTQSSIFAAPAETATTTKSSIFNSSLPASTTGVEIQTSTTQSVFGKTSTATGFGVSTAATTLSSIFGAASSTSTSFGSSTTSSTQPSIFGTNTTTSTSFGQSITSTSQSSIFGTNTSTSTDFGTSTSSTKPSLFGTPPSTTATSLFGTPTPATPQSIFGSAIPNQSSVFGKVVSSAAPQPIFGNSTSTTSQPSQGFGIFGDGTQKTSIFGGSPSTTQSSVFGTSNQSSVFGNVASTSTAAFGQNQSSSIFGQAPAFGATGSSFGSSNVFGTSASSFGQPSGSIFGNTPSTTSGSIFGGSAPTGNTFSSSGIGFGNSLSSASSPFGSEGVFPTSTTTSMGFGSLSVGPAATTSSSGFGSSSASNPFGNKTVFGSSSPPSGNSGFGSSFSSPSQSFGGGFGSPSAFGQQQASFGQASFGNSSFGQASSGPFSSGSTGGIAQTGFGTGTNFQKSPGFGGSPVFGGSPSFGNAPSFGGAPAFGTSSSSFSSGSKIFGGTNPGFGTAVGTQSAGFGNLANQQTVGFGNLAQQATNAATPNTPFSGNSSFSNWR